MINENTIAITIPFLSTLPFPMYTLQKSHRRHQVCSALSDSNFRNYFPSKNLLISVYNLN